MSRLIVASAVALAASGARVKQHSGGASDDLRRTSPEQQIAAQGGNKHILCPALAAMHEAGDLIADVDGNVELEDMKNGLMQGLGVGETAASFQAYGISIFDEDEKHVGRHRRRCLPPGNIPCYAARKVGLITSSTRRYMNLYTMHSKQTLEHGISTGVRGGDANMPPNALGCGGVYPCRSRFEQFWLSNVRNGRMYMSDVLNVVCLARQFGDRSGENSFADNEISLYGNFTLEPVPGREWQMKGAMTSLLSAFGKLDSNGDRYLSRQDLEALVMEGRYPDGFQRREPWGCLVFGCGDESSLERFRMNIENCPMGEYDEWWQGSGCKTSTNVACSSNSPCAMGQACVSGTCRCGRDETGRSTCFSGGRCQKQQQDSYSWFSWDRAQMYVPANDPEAPGNFDTQ